MTQNQIDRQVARKTGESVGFIRRLGFNVVIVPHRSYRPRQGGAQASTEQTNGVVTKIQQPKAA